MNSAEVLRRLVKEKKEWMQTGPTVEAQFVIRGLNLSIMHVRNILKEQMSNERLRKPRINHWIAGDLFHAIEVALGYLGRADKKRAVHFLEKARDHAAREKMR